MDFSLRWLSLPDGCQGNLSNLPRVLVCRSQFRRLLGMKQSLGGEHPLWLPGRHVEVNQGKAVVRHETVCLTAESFEEMHFCLFVGVLYQEY